MAEKVTALLIQEEKSCFEALQAILIKLGIDARRTTSCAESLPLLALADCPMLVFTDIHLPDGTWADVLKLSETAQGPVKVVVVSRVVDVSLYLDVLESGGFDFIVPPFHPTEVAHIVRCATEGWHVGQDENRRRGGFKSSPVMGAKKSKANWGAGNLSETQLPASGSA